MVGGETVTFDLDMNRKTKKKEAVRIKLAPLGANLKNSKDPKTNSRKNKPKNSNSVCIIHAITSLPFCNDSVSNTINL